MKMNWINIVATILIVAGIFLLTKRAHAPVAGPTHGTTTAPVSPAEMKDKVIKQIEVTLGRPLDPIEHDMVVIERQGNLVQIKIFEPLNGRIEAANRQHAATQPGYHASTPGVDSTTPTLPGSPTPESAGVAQPAPTTLPTGASR